jgi:hypothetical protein
VHRQRPAQSPEAGRPWLAVLAGVLAVAAALLAALVSDPRLLRLAVLLAITAAIPFGIAATSTTGNRRLADEVAMLRGLVEELARRPQPAALPPTVALAVASSASGVHATGSSGPPAYTTVPITVTSERPDVPPVLDIDLRALTAAADDDDPAARPALRLPLVQAALRDVDALAGAREWSAATSSPYVVDLTALESELQHSRFDDSLDGSRLEDSRAES